MRKTVSIVGMIILLVGTIILDLTFYRYEKTLDRTLLASVIPLGSEIPAYIGLAVLLLALAWFVLYFNPRSYWVALAYIGIGAFVLFSFSIFGLYWWVFHTNLGAIVDWYADAVVSGFSFAQFSAAIILVIGLVRLLPDRFLWRR